MKLSVGKIKFPIEFDNGDKDFIEFNPNDPDLATRLIRARDNISDKLDNLETENVKIKADGNVEIPETVDGFDELSEEQKQVLIAHSEQMTDILEKTKEIMCDEIDHAFNGDISRVVFKHCSPLAIVNGEYFIVQFFNAIAPEIQKQVAKANKEAEKKMAKHIEKYQNKR